MYELVLKLAFEACSFTPSELELLIFKRFHKAWINVDVSKFYIRIEDQLVMNNTANDKRDILQLAKWQLAT